MSITESDIITHWRYTERVSEVRRAALASPGRFAELVRLVSEEATEIRVRTSPGRDGSVAHCRQPVFTLKLSTMGDPLFNGPCGYRAQYWLSPFLGLAANAALISALMPKLLAAVDLEATPELAKIDVCNSLRATSAKIWIQEGNRFSKVSADLNVERWREQARRGVHLASLGLCAPQVTTFEVKGALIDPFGNEVVPAKKVHRHNDIHLYGFS